MSVLFSPQSSLTKFAESLQEMINYHTVCYRCRVKLDLLSLLLFAPLDSCVMTKLSLGQLFNCQEFNLLLGRTEVDYKKICL